MSRIHLFEIEDQKWFPTFLRNYMTDFLQFLSNKTKLYQPVIPVIEKGLEASKNNQIIDLASGGGGGLLWLNTELLKTKPDLKILLTDYYPNKKAFRYTQKQAENFEFVAEPVDARNVPENFKGLRTQFLSFHHFETDDAKQILQNAVNTKSNIAIFEAQERSFLSIMVMLLSPISVLLVTPFIKPFSFGRIIFTYLIPIVPICVLWDGVVSSLRTYSVEEMKELVKGLENQDAFNWEINKVKGKSGYVIYLLATLK
ncbi:hypothetical protein [Flavobacterium sp.]|uniref:hypothetical protein n=1 Tax=Flavobacterium sp. TaxID=239 RepID=UPI0028BF5739|nr:hypothetical protein [Flavobacterium sp.]